MCSSKWVGGQEVLRLLGELFGEGYMCLMGLSEETRLPSALLLEERLCITPKQMGVQG